MRNSLSVATAFAIMFNYTGKNYNAKQVVRWLNGAEINGAGKFIFVEEIPDTEKYPGAPSIFYIVRDVEKLRRCGKMFAEDMLAAGKGVHDGTTAEFHARRGW